MSGFRIPDAGNILGGSAVETRTSNVQPLGAVKAEGMDIAPVMDTMQNVAKAVAQYKEAEDDALFQQMANQFDAEMAQRQVDVFNNNRGFNSKDIYNRHLRGISEDIFNDLTGEPKDDGKIRAGSPAAARRFRQYVDSRQRSLIAAGANFEANEWAQAERQTYELALVERANNIAATNVDAVIAQNMLEIEDIVRSQNRQLIGHPEGERYLRLLTARQQDIAAAGNIQQLIVTNPIAAKKQMEDNPYISNYLTSDTRRRLDTAIQQAYTERQKQNVIEGNNSELRGDVIQMIFGVGAQQALMIEQEITNEAMEKQAAQQARFAESHARVRANAMDAFLNAKTDQDEERAMMALADNDPVMARFAIETMELIEAEEAAFEIMRGMEYKPPPSRARLEKLEGHLERAEAMQRRTGGLLSAPGEFASGIRDLIREEQESFDQEMSEYQLKIEALPPAERRLVEKQIERVNNRVRENADLFEVFGRIAAGERDVDALGLDRFDGRTRRTMFRNMVENDRFNAFKAELGQANINLDQEIAASRFQELRSNPVQQQKVQHALMRYMQEYKTQNKGAWPSVNERRQFINQAIADSRTRANNLSDSMKNQTTGSRLDTVLMSSNRVIKTRNNTFQDQYNRRQQALRDAIRAGNFSSEERRVIRQHEDLFIHADMQGDASWILGVALGEIL